MKSRMNARRVGPWTRRVWLLPLALLLFACGGGGDGGAGTPQAPGQPAQPESVPEDLRGQWEAVLTYVPPFYSGPYGDVPQGDGSLGITFYFWPDGRYQLVWNMAQSYFGGNCFRSGGWEEFGTLSRNGAEYLFTPRTATYMQMDSCAGAKYLNPAPVSAASHRLVVDRDPTGWPMLRMSYPGWELVLEKCRRC